MKLSNWQGKIIAIALTLQVCITDCVQLRFCFEDMQSRAASWVK